MARKRFPLNSLTRYKGQPTRSYASDLDKPLKTQYEEVIEEARQTQRLGGQVTPQSVMERVQRRLDVASSYQQEKRARTTNLDTQSHRQAWHMHYNPQPAKGFFPVTNELQTSQGFVSLDIETDDYGNPITISATKFYRDDSGQFRAVDNFQRYYKAKNANLQQTYPVHGMTRGILNKRRAEQGATYSAHYDWREKAALRQFLRNQVIVGHNIHEFDLPKLFGDTPLPNSTVDTLVAARDIWRGKKNDLDTVFQRLFGKNMEQAGLPHHDANSDAIATMMIYDALSHSKTDMGRAIQYIEKNPVGVHVSTRDNYIKSLISYGNYRDYLTKGGEVYMSEKETNIKLANGGYLTPQEMKGMHEIEEPTSNGASSDAMNAIGDVMSYMSEKLTMTQDMTSDLQQAFNQFTNYRRGALVRQIVNMSEEEQIRTLRAHGITGNLSKTMRKQAAAIGDVHERESRERFHEEAEAIKRENIRRKGEYNPSWSEHYWKFTSKEMEDAARSAELLEKVGDALGRIASIPTYNFERLEGVFTEQVGGISHAAKKLMPRFLGAPISSFTDASMNALREEYANLKYGVRFASQIGNVAMGVGMGMPGPAGVAFKGAGALLSAGSQAVGNYGEAKLVKWGQGIQNNLNTLNLLTDITLMPFKLFGDALKTATGLLRKFHVSLHGLSRFMTSQLASLSGMGNPMTQMTGLGYGDYMGMVSADYASLLGKGTLSSVINDMATQRASLYTTGDLDVKRLVAASMLGVFDEVYGTGANEEDQLTGAINKLIASMDGQTEFQKKQTYMLANRINPNMGSILQTMNTLGIRDFNQLKSPAGMVGYSNTQYDMFRPQWQRAYWEYSYAKEQWNTSKNVVASALWGRIGKPVANAGNAFAKSFALALNGQGSWDDVQVSIRNIFTSLKEGANSAWDVIKKTFGMEGDLKFGDFLKAKLWGAAADIVKLARETIVPAFDGIWDSIVKHAFDVFGGFIDYLSTIKMDWGQLIKNYQTGDWSTPFISSATDRMKVYSTSWAQNLIKESEEWTESGWRTSSPAALQKEWAEQHGLPIASVVTDAAGLARYAQWGELYKSSKRLANEQFPEFSTGEMAGPADSMYKAYKSIKSSGDIVLDEALLTLQNIFSNKAMQAQSKVNIEINGKKTDTSLVVSPSGGVSVLRDNIHVDAVPQNGVLQYVFNQSTGMGGL